MVSAPPSRLIIAGAAVYAINVWSSTRKETAPGRNLEPGIERVKEAASKAAAERQCRAGQGHRQLTVALSSRFAWALTA